MAPDRKGPVPSAKDLNQLNERQNKNFVRQNLKKVVFDKQSEAKRMKSPDEMAALKPQMHKNHGQVPNYIQKYRRQDNEKLAQKRWEEEQALLPPGTRLMPEEERQDTLRDLKAAKNETENAMQRLPVVGHSLKMNKHKKELEDKLNRLDRAIETFSKEKVYVAL